MVTWWLILLACVLGVLILGLSFYFVFIFSSEADDGAAYFPKAVAILGLTLALITVLLLPFDVATQTDPTSFVETATVTMQELWEGIFWTVTVFVVVIIPFTTFYYEALDPEAENGVTNQICSALIYTLMLMIFFTIVSVVSWYMAGIAEIPYWSYSGVPQYKSPLDASLVYVDYKTVEQLNLNVSLFVYVIAMLAFFGWILFMFYGGVGLIALPYDLVTEFLNRPPPITKAQFDGEVLAIAQRAKQMQAQHKELHREQMKKNNNAVRQKVNEFRNEVIELEEKLEQMIIAYTEQGGSPFVVYGKLMLGVLSVCLTIMWLLHILLYNGFRVHAFLNEMLISLDQAFALLGVLAYALFAFYLLWATVKGCIKVGMRIVFFTIHPMKMGDTLMNSMLFNIGLILLTAVTVVQFCATSFDLYSSNTSVDALLNLYVRRLRNLGVIIFYLQYIFLGIAILSIFWVIMCPKKKKEEKKAGGAKS